MPDEKKSVDLTEQALNKKMSRRNFIQGTGLAVGGLIIGGGIGGVIGAKMGKDSGSAPAPTKLENKAPKESVHVNHSEAMQFFTRKEDFEVLAAATEVIFPEDEHGPGAIGLGVPYFIDKQLASPWGRNADDYRVRPLRTGKPL